MTWLQRVTAWLGVSGFGEIFRESSVRDGFVTGLAFGLVLPVGIYILLWLVRRRRRKSTGLMVRGEHGDLHVSVPAVREFVMRIVSEFSEAVLRSVHMQRRGTVEVINIGIDAVPGTDLIALHASLSSRVKEEAAKKLGLDGDRGRINVTVDHYSASESKAAKRARRLLPGRGRADTPEPSSGTGSPGAEPPDGAALGTDTANAPEA